LAFQPRKNVSTLKIDKEAQETIGSRKHAIASSNEMTFAVILRQVGLLD
jgi:hypothetical protein